MAETERDALLQVLDALETLQIPYMVVGSFASTFWGRPRMTHDADLVVELAGEKAAGLARLLTPHFYAPLFVIENAVRKRGQFNLIHVGTTFKADVFLPGVLFEREVWVCSPEDVILSKLLWYRAAPALERQFQDVVEVYEIQEPYLEHDYLARWASALGITDLLERVMQEATRPPGA